MARRHVPAAISAADGQENRNWYAVAIFARPLLCAQLGPRQLAIDVRKNRSVGFDPAGL
jgi:hypothetical protein